MRDAGGGLDQGGGARGIFSTTEKPATPLLLQLNALSCVISIVKNLEVVDLDYQNTIHPLESYFAWVLA